MKTTTATPAEQSATQLLFYVASRASIPARGQMWRGFREQGHKITSSWIDEDGEGATDNFTELWDRIQAEIAASDYLILYAQQSDFPLKGALIEVGMALAMGKAVIVCLPGVEVAERTCRPIGSWIAHRLVERNDDVRSILNNAALTPTQAVSEQAAERQCPVCQQAYSNQTWPQSACARGYCPALVQQAAEDAKPKERRAHKVMTVKEYYSVFAIQGWHEVCRNVDGMGNVGVRYLGESVAQPPIVSPLASVLSRIDHEVKDNFLSLEFDPARAEEDWKEAHRILDSVAEIIEDSVEQPPIAANENEIVALYSRALSDVENALRGLYVDRHDDARWISLDESKALIQYLRSGCVVQPPIASDDESQSSYEGIFAGTCSVGYADCTLLDFARGIKYFIDAESHKPDCDTHLINTLRRAACFGWELVRKTGEPLSQPPIAAESQTETGGVVIRFNKWFAGYANIHGIESDYDYRHMLEAFAEGERSCKPIAAVDPASLSAERCAAIFNEAQVGNRTNWRVRDLGEFGFQLVTDEYPVREIDQDVAQITAAHALEHDPSCREVSK